MAPFNDVLLFVEKNGYAAGVVGHMQTNGPGAVPASARTIG
jgi:hypothetical protein